MYSICCNAILSREGRCVAAVRTDFLSLRITEAPWRMIRITSSWSCEVCPPAASPCHCLITREIRRLGKCHQMEGVGAAANNGLKWVPWVEWYEIFSPRWEWVTAEDICSLLRAIPGPGAGLYKEEAWQDTLTRAVSCKVCVRLQSAPNKIVNRKPLRLKYVLALNWYYANVQHTNM